MFLRLGSRSKLLQLASRSKFLQLGSRSKLLQLRSLDNLSKILWNPSLILRFPSRKIWFSLLKVWFSSTAFRFPRNLRKSSSTAFQFLQRLSNFFNSFPLSSTAFRFLQQLSDFFNGFPIFLNGFLLSEKSGKIYLWRQVYERSLSELRISAKITIFCDKIIGGKNTKDHYPSFVFSAPSSIILAN